MAGADGMEVSDLARQPSRLQYIAVLRAMAMLVVVAFHTYGYMYASHFPQSREGYNAIYYTANQCVFINVAMPLFTAIAGFLFAWLHQQGRYQDYWQMIRKKALRLLLPFAVFGTLMMATTGVPSSRGCSIGGRFRIYGISLRFSGASPSGESRNAISPDRADAPAGGGEYSSCCSLQTALPIISLLC